MKFIVLEIQTNTDGAVGTLINAYDDRNSAESKYHLVLSAAAVSQLPMHSATLLMSDGRMLAYQNYVHSENPEPSPEVPEE